MSSNIRRKLLIALNEIIIFILTFFGTIAAWYFMCSYTLTPDEVALTYGYDDISLSSLVGLAMWGMVKVGYWRHGGFE